MMTKLNDTMVQLFVTMQCMLQREEGQDLVEYALLVALISLAAVAALQTLGKDINSAFTTIGTALTTYTG